jgi:type II secretory pathway pseudopilin PulG
MKAIRAAAKSGQPGRRTCGYTLLEIALVVAIIVLLVGAVVPLSSGFVREQRLRESVRGLLVLAKTARTEAMTGGRTAEVVFGKGGFALLRAGEEESSESVRLPRGTRYQLLPFGADKPLRPDGQRWIFQPTGLCEPLTVRIMEDEAWIEVRFDPLTAGIEEESYYIP